MSKIAIFYRSEGDGEPHIESISKNLMDVYVDFYNYVNEHIEDSSECELSEYNEPDCIGVEDLEGETFVTDTEGWAKFEIVEI